MVEGHVCMLFILLTLLFLTQPVFFQGSLYGNNIFHQCESWGTCLWGLVCLYWLFASPLVVDLNWRFQCQPLETPNFTWTFPILVSLGFVYVLCCCICLCMYVYVCIDVYLYVYLFVCMSICACMYICACMCYVFCFLLIHYCFQLENFLKISPKKILVGRKASLVLWLTREPLQLSNWPKSSMPMETQLPKEQWSIQFSQSPLLCSSTHAHTILFLPRKRVSARHNPVTQTCTSWSRRSSSVKHVANRCHMS